MLKALWGYTRSTRPRGDRPTAAMITSEGGRVSKFPGTVYRNYRLLCCYCVRHAGVLIRGGSEI